MWGMFLFRVIPIIILVRGYIYILSLDFNTPYYDLLVVDVESGREVYYHMHPPSPWFCLPSLVMDTEQVELLRAEWPSAYHHLTPYCIGTETIEVIILLLERIIT